MRRFVPWMALAAGAAGAALVSRAAERRAPPAGAAEAFVATDFRVCDRPGGRAVAAARGMDEAELATLVHGAWVGSRVARDGRSLMPGLVQGREPPGHYVLILDMHAGRGIAYEERGPDVRENAFERQLPAAGRDPPRIVQLYCGGNRFHAFRDEFVRVSTDPRDGLRALARVTGIRAGEASVEAAWKAMTSVDFFVRPRGRSVVTGAYYVITTEAVRERGVGPRAVRWRMVGEYRGTPAKFTRGQPVSGVESGVFTGVETRAGTWLVAGAAVNTALAVTSAGGVDVGRAESTSDADQTYTRMVIGPLPRSNPPAHP